MRWLALVLMLATCLPPSRAGWRTALPGWEYQFPRDHGNHDGFKTEWWYFTGNLKASDGREFGYQLTFFRQGVMSPDQDLIPLSRFVTRHMKMAHFALTDLSTGKFYHFQKLSRGAYDEAGFEEGRRLAWIEGWSCELTGEHAFHLRAQAGEVALDLRVTSAKGPVIHGTGGVSQKATGAGRGSHYYSLTRMVSEGEVIVDGSSLPVTGESWFDHEWATNQLAEGQIGWDWLSLQFDNGGELMLFQLRERGGGRDEHSSGTFVDAAGKAFPIKNKDFSMEPGKVWKSPVTGAEYPVEWKVSIPGLDFYVEVRAPVPDQELNFKPVSYWEGVVRALGTHAGRAVKAKGYLEMTGYAGGIAGMQEIP